MNGSYGDKNEFFSINLDKILFLDVETVPMCKSFEELPDKFKPLWENKAKRFSQQEEKPAEELFFEKAGIIAEFGKIVCVSAGFFSFSGENERVFRVKAFSSDDEKLLLTEFKSMLDGYFNRNNNYLCGHNGKEFDFPYLSRRMLINGIRLPEALNNFGKKPWETRFLDTMELWKFGDHKNYTSLDLLAALFDIPTPKDDISGKDVADVYWNANDLKRIAEYCNKDVITTARLFLKFRGEKDLEDEEVVVTN